jgi:hypothetical protein
MITLTNMELEGIDWPNDDYHVHVHALPLPCYIYQIDRAVQYVHYLLSPITIIISIHGGTDQAQGSMLNKWEFTEFMLRSMHEC